MILELIERMRLKDKVAIVTGSGRGIGRAIAIAFAREGAKVVVNALHMETAGSTADEIKAMGGQSLVVIADVSEREQVASMVEKTVERFGRVDILVNNAGIPRWVKPSIEETEEGWDRLMAVNLKGVFFCSQEAAKKMIPQGGGKIINISSISGLVAHPQRAAYCSAKAAVIMLTKVLAIEWAEHNIQVNAIAPGSIETEYFKKLYRTRLTDEEDKWARRTPMRRHGRPEEVADAAVFLASQEASFITGETLVVDGGWVAYGYL